MYDQFVIIVINFVCIVLQLLMTIVLWLSKIRKGIVYLSIIILVCTVPVYCANMLRDIGSYDVFVKVGHLAIFANVLLMPMIWFFARSQLEAGFRFRLASLYHFLPAVVSFVISILYYHEMSPDELFMDIAREASGSENLAHIVNDVIVFLQVFVYFTMSFLLIRKSKKTIQDNYFDSEYFNLRWTVNFVYLMALMFFVVFVAYVISPRTDSWLIPILNVLITCYIVYNAIHYPVTRLQQAEVSRVFEKGNNGIIVDDPKLQEYAEVITSHLESTKMFTKLDLSLRDVAKATGISDKNVSMAINKQLGCSFFELINKMRIDEAKRLMLLPESSLITIEAISLSCGFRSRSSFYSAFRRFENTSPTNWMKTIVR